VVVTGALLDASLQAVSMAAARIAPPRLNRDFEEGMSIISMTRAGRDRQP